MRLGLLACVALLGSGCGSAPPVTLAPDAEGVQADKLSAPPGARSLGPVEGSHGGGCGLFATKGTYEGALSNLRNRAAELGGNYVQIDAVTEPHDDSGCTTGGYVIRGIVYFVPNGPPPAPAEAAEPPKPGVCDPPCSPGFACQAGACIPVCNPPCEANEVCTRKRTCEPVAPAPSAVAPASSSAAAAPPASSPPDAGTTRDARAD